MLDDGVLFQGRLHLVGQRKTLPGESLFAVDLAEDLRGLAQRAHGEEVRRDEEVEGRGVVRGPERGDDQPHGVDRIAPPVAALGIQLAVGGPAEVVGSGILLALLGAERREDVPHGLDPDLSEDGLIARRFPVVVGQPDGIAVGVDLPLALVYFGEDRRSGLVRLPVASRRPVVEGVGVGVRVDELELPDDDPRNHVAEVFVAGCQLHVGPDLGAGVAEPHGMDVARIDERVVETVLALVLEMDGGVERVREAVAEHPGQFGVGKHPLDLGNGLLDGLGDEQPVLRRGALRLKVLSREHSDAQQGGKG